MLEPGGARSWRRSLGEEKRIAAQRIAAMCVERIETLLRLGLGYLSSSDRRRVVAR